MTEIELPPGWVNPGPAPNVERDYRVSDYTVSEWTGLAYKRVRALRDRRPLKDYATGSPSRPEVVRIWRALGWQANEQLLALEDSPPQTWNLWFEAYIQAYADGHPELGYLCGCGCGTTVFAPDKWVQTIHTVNYVTRMVNAARGGRMAQARATISVDHPELLERFDRNLLRLEARDAGRANPLGH